MMVDAFGCHQSIVILFKAITFLIRNTYGRKIRMLTILEEFSQNCLNYHCARRIRADQVLTQLANAMIVHGIPEYIRSDNGAELKAYRLRK